jgi:Fe-S cluster biogenesis protein NfuA
VTLTQGGAEVLLAEIRNMLRADGYEMVVQVGEGEVAVSVVATDGACEECLVPSDLMTEIIRDSLGEGSGGSYAGLISVQYPPSTVGGGSAH